VGSSTNMEDMGNESSDASIDLLSDRECWERLRSEPYGRLAVVGPDGPVIYPINAIVDHATVVFRTTEGSKIEAIRADPRVAFEVDGWNATTGTAWSVGITGVAREIVEVIDGASVAELDVTPWQAGPKPIFVRITPDSVAGQEFARTGRTGSDEPSPA